MTSQITLSTTVASVQSGLSMQIAAVGNLQAANLSVTQASLASTAASLSGAQVASQITLSTALASVQGGLSTQIAAVSGALGAAQASTGAQVAGLNSTLQGFMQQAGTYYVDKRNLSVIDGEVGAVITSLVAPGSSSPNSLGTQLAQLNASLTSVTLLLNTKVNITQAVATIAAAGGNL